MLKTAGQANVKSGAKQIRCLPEAVAVSRETTGWLYFFTEQEND